MTQIEEATVALELHRLEQDGSIDPDCKPCIREWYGPIRDGRVPHFPKHNNRCGAAWPHCTCWKCW